MDYANDYKERKGKLINILNKGAELFHSMEKEGDEVAMRNLASQCERGTFSVVVVGAFSSGKSTMLNALMGERYLPSFTKETTATVNFLMSADLSPEKDEDGNGKELIVVNYNDGTSIRIEDVTLENIEKYVSVNGDQVAQKVKSVDIYLKGSKFLKDGVSLVDSPGLNGIAEGHTAITNQQIKESHAAIYMFNAHQSSGTKSDFEALKALKDKCNSLLIVINQIDCINAAEGQTVESVIKDLKDNYHKQFPNDPLPEIFPLAAYLALIYRSKRYDLTYNNEKCDAERKEKLYEKSRIEDFEQRLWRFLAGSEKTKAELTSPLEQVLNSISELTSTIDKELELLNGEKSFSELEAEKEEIQKAIDNIENDMATKRAELLPKMTDLITDVKDKIQGDMRSVRTKYIDDISNTVDIDLLKSSYQRYANRMLSEIQDKYSDAIKELNQKFSRTVIQECGRLTAEISEKINKSKADDQLSTTDFRIDMSSFPSEADLTQFMNQIDTVSNELDRLYDEEEEIMMKMSERDSLKYASEKLERALNKSTEDQNNNLSSLGARPEPMLKMVAKSRRSKGIWGGIKLLWNGNPASTEYTKEYDYSNVQAYDRNRQDILDKFEDERREIQIKIERAEQKLSSLHSLDVQKTRNERAIERVNKEMQRLREKMEDKSKKESERILADAKNCLYDKFEEIDRQKMSEIKTNLNKLDKGLCEMAETIIISSFETALDDKKKELERCEKSIKADAKVKEERKNFLTAKKEEIGELREDALDLKSEIDTMETDKIERE